MAYIQKKSPFAKKKTKGGGTRKVCLPKAKIASMSAKDKLLLALNNLRLVKVNTKDLVEVMLVVLRVKI